MTPAQAEEVLASKPPAFSVKTDTTLLQTANDQQLCSQFIALMKSTFQENKILRAKALLLTESGLIVKFIPAPHKPTDFNHPDTVSAVFYNDVNRIDIFMLNFKKSKGIDVQITFSHEIEHAYKTLIHKYRYQQSDSIPDPGSPDYALPYYPNSNSERSKIKTLIQIGDKRIQEFFLLLEEKAPLSTEKKIKLDHYKKAADTYSLRTSYADLPKVIPPNSSCELIMTHQETVNSGKGTCVIPTSLSINSTSITIGFRARHIEDKESHFRLTGEYVKYYGNLLVANPSYNFMYNMLYRDARLEVRQVEPNLTTEQHAHIVGDLPYNILEVFYPELLAYDEQDTAAALEIILAKPEKTSIAAQLVQSNPLFTATTQHNAFMTKIADYRTADREPFFNALEQKQYGQALRRACTATDDTATILVKILLEHKDLLNFDINETNKTGDSAYSIAESKGNVATCDMLKTYGATPPQLKK